MAKPRTKSVDAEERRLVREKERLEATREKERARTLSRQEKATAKLLAQQEKEKAALPCGRALRTKPAPPRTKPASRARKVKGSREQAEAILAAAIAEIPEATEGSEKQLAYARNLRAGAIDMLRKDFANLRDHAYGGRDYGSGPMLPALRRAAHVLSTADAEKAGRRRATAEETQAIEDRGADWIVMEAAQRAAATLRSLAAPVARAAGFWIKNGSQALRLSALVADSLPTLHPEDRSVQPRRPGDLPVRELPSLEGSERQVAWATKIRAEKIGYIEGLVARALDPGPVGPLQREDLWNLAAWGGDVRKDNRDLRAAAKARYAEIRDAVGPAEAAAALRASLEAALPETSAKWWIENRDRIGKGIEREAGLALFGRFLPVVVTPAAVAPPPPRMVEVVALDEGAPAAQQWEAELKLTTPSNSKSPPSSIARVFKGGSIGRTPRPIEAGVEGEFSVGRDYMVGKRRERGELRPTVTVDGTAITVFELDLGSQRWRFGVKGMRPIRWGDGSPFDAAPRRLASGHDVYEY